MEDRALETQIQSVQDMLRACLLFQNIEEKDLEIVAEHLQLVEFKKGDPIILEGELSDHVYFVRSGTVEIVKYHSELQQVLRVAMLKPGAHFSEFSVLNQSNKTASAFANEDSELYRLDGDKFLMVLDRLPIVAQRLATRLAELNDKAIPESFLEYYRPSLIAFSAEIPRLVPSTIWKKYGILPLSYQGGILQFASKDPSRADFHDYCKGAGITAQLNVVLIGEEDYEAAFKNVSTLYSKATPPPRPNLKAVPDPEDIATCLKRSTYFADIEDAGVEHLAKMFEPQNFSAGQVIFSPGDAQEYFYLIQTGKVALSRPKPDKRGWTHLTHRGSGEGLGEISILLNKPHQHLARAETQTTILRLKREYFEQFMSFGVFCINLSKVLAKRLQTANESAGVKFYSGTKSPDLTEMSKLIPRQIMQQNQVIPLALKENEITLGTVNPGNEAIFSIAGRYLRGYRIHLELITAENFRAWMMQGAEKEVKPSAAVAAAAAAKLENQNVAAQELNKLLQHGFDSRASDLHLEPTGTGYCVRYRVDGVLNEANKIPREQGETIVNRIKVMSGMDITNRFTPQDGQLKVKEEGLDLNARVSTVPTRQGEGAVLRLIRNRSSAVPLSVLAPDTRVVKLLKAVTKCKQGLFLVTGPTGSGKTTTLYSLINEVNRVDVKIITLEDPIELEINGATQIEINDRTGLTFERALKSTLRQDPDIMMVGEIRDEESAKIVFEAALSGHLVISTLHTNSALAVKARLKELGVKPGTMAAGLIGSMAQRLVRAICKKCREFHPITPAEKKYLAEKLHLDKFPHELAIGKGCPACNYTGYHGRLPIMEVWRKDRAMEDVLSSDGTLEQMLECARKDDYDTLFEFGLKMALNGLTTIEEVERCMAGAG